MTDLEIVKRAGQALINICHKNSQELTEGNLFKKYVFEEVINDRINDFIEKNKTLNEKSRLRLIKLIEEDKDEL